MSADSEKIALENPSGNFEAKREALKIAASFYTGLTHPDAKIVVEMARTFETYLAEGDTGTKATAYKRGPYSPRKVAGT